MKIKINKIKIKSQEKEEKTKKTKNININNNIILIFLIKLLILIYRFIRIQNNIFYPYYFQYSKISLKIKGIGDSSILGNDTGFPFKDINYLNEVSINGIRQEIIGYRYYFNQTDNYVELTWNDELKKCDNMFSRCINITEIDLSNFDTSNIISMSLMFYDCKSLNYLELSNLDTSKVESMYYMFYNCYLLISLNLTKFNTSNVRNMNSMFTFCSALTSLYLSNFDTSQVTDMDRMFYGCQKLNFLDISNFNTSKVTSMNYMFCNCFSLKSLDLSTFDTSKVKSMNFMFDSCRLLDFVDLSTFNTSQVQEMDRMFYGCQSLKYLDLSNFDTSKVTTMNYMFYNCSSLTTLNLKNFISSQIKDILITFDPCINLEYIIFNNLKRRSISYDDMFSGIPENVAICISDNITKKNYFPETENEYCHNINYSNDRKTKQKIAINNTNVCIESCNSKYDYNITCIEMCIDMLLFADNNITLNKCKCELDKCLICPQLTLNNNLCTLCNIDYYPKENDSLNKEEYVNCYNKPEGYYLDKNIYKLCYHTCKTCNIEGNNLTHNCIQCNQKFFFGIKNNDYFNCYENCSYYHYIDKGNNFICKLNLSCPEEYPILIENSLECIKYDFETVIKILLEKEKNQTINSKDEEIIYYDNIIKIIEDEFISDNYNTSKIDNGQDEIIKTEKIITTLTTSENQRNNKNNNMTRIDLGECETKLRNFYNISINESLYIKKLDITQDGMKTLKVEYNVYAKLFGKNLTKLNLTLCEKSKITISIPIVLNEPLDKLNSSSAYYNDICYTTNSEDGTDIIIKDRQTEFIDKDRIVCQENCDFSEYNYETFVAQCSCEVKESSQSFADMNINKAKIFDNFKNIKNFLNFNFLVCYKQLFNIKGIVNNIGCYIIFTIIFFHIIAIFVFSISQFSLLKYKIKIIAYEKRNEKDKVYKTTNKIKYNRKNKNSNKNYIKKNAIKKRSYQTRNKITLNDTKIKFDSSVINNDIDKKEKKIKYIDEEINGFSYNLAKKYDKRTYCVYYVSLIKTQHNLICTFFNYNDYNSSIIKMDLFFIGFTIEYTVNALFYNDDTMHKIYEAKGDFDLETQIPIAVYSTIISMILNYPLNSLALSNDAIINFKWDKSKIILKKAKALEKILLIKFVLYFIISFLFLLFFWYYISMFGVIYKNTQIHLLKDTFISFGLSLAFPFIYYFLPGIFRIPALSAENNKRKYLYNFSKLLQSF